MAVVGVSKVFSNRNWLNITKSAYAQRRFLSASIDQKYVAIPEIKSFICRCMTAVGTKEEHGQELADVLVAADYRGHFSHGLNRLGEQNAHVVF